jgi:septal ring factor EnvC (AmiA/AmiB activator)
MQGPHFGREHRIPVLRMMFLATCKRPFLLAGLVAGLLAGAGNAAENARDLESLERQIGSSETRQAEIANEIKRIRDEAEAISRKLIDTAQAIQARETQVQNTERRLATLGAEELEIKIELAAKQDVLSELLAGLQRLEQNPPPALVVEPGDILGALRGAMMFGTVVPELRTEAEKLAQKLARLENIRAKAKAERENLQDTIAKLASSHTELEELQKRKKELLAVTAGRLKDEQRRARELAAKATSLKQLLDNLADEQKRQQAAAEKQRLEDEAAAKLREAALLKPRQAFMDLRGRLDFPVQGEIVRKFGEDDGFGSEVKGLYLAARSGAQITAPNDARVEFAGPFRSYGQLLILDAGNGYHVLLAGLGKVTAETGQFIRAGEPVGAMGESPAPGTLTGDRLQDSRPVLYIEFRKNGEAIDSSPWWIGAVREARG